MDVHVSTCPSRFSGTRWAYTILSMWFNVVANLAHNWQYVSAWGQPWQNSQQFFRAYCTLTASVCLQYSYPQRSFQLTKNTKHVFSAVSIEAMKSVFRLSRAVSEISLIVSKFQLCFLTPFHFFYPPQGLLRLPSWLWLVYSLPRVAPSHRNHWWSLKDNTQVFTQAETPQLRSFALDYCAQLKNLYGYVFVC